MDNQPFTNEAGLLACLIHKRELHAQLPLSLNHDKFRDPRLAKAFEIYQRILQETQSPPDAISWERELDTAGVNSATDKLIAAIYNSVPIDYAIPENIRMYADGILKEWTRRECIRLGGEIQTKMQTGDVDIDEAMKLLESRVFDISRQSSSAPPVKHISQVVGELEDYQDKVREGIIKTLNTGYKDIDKLLDGIEDGWILVVGAATGMGKTSFCMGIALNVAKDGNPVAIVSLEMSGIELVQKLVCLESGLDYNKVRKERFNGNQEEIRLYKETKKYIASLPIYIEDVPGVTVADIESRCKQLKIEKGIRLVIVDHLGLVDSPKNSMSLYQSMTENAKAMKRMAGRLRIPVIEAVQLSRFGDRKDSRPKLSDLKDSGEVENSANAVVFIYRDDYYFPDECENPNIAEINLAKFRHGATGKVEMYWDKARAAFKDLVSKALRL